MKDFKEINKIGLYNPSNFMARRLIIIYIYYSVLRWIIINWLFFKSFKSPKKREDININIDPMPSSSLYTHFAYHFGKRKLSSRYSCIWSVRRSVKKWQMMMSIIHPVI